MSFLAAGYVLRSFQALHRENGFSRPTVQWVLANSYVSIPSRGLWVFPLCDEITTYENFLVSIPSRVLWVFPLFWTLKQVLSLVSIPSRGLWVFPLNRIVLFRFKVGCFNP